MCRNMCFQTVTLFFLPKMILMANSKIICILYTKQKRAKQKEKEGGKKRQLRTRLELERRTKNKAEV